jgi:hypothetical protein
VTAVAKDKKPPRLLVRTLNPIMRAVLRTPLGRLVNPVAVLEFTGRRSGRCYRVPVGWHQVRSEPAVFSPAPWRVNFAGGVPVAVYHRGRRRAMTGTLVTDPDVVADALQAMFDAGASPKGVGIDAPAGHRFTAADVVAVDRALIRFEPAEP